MTPKMQTLEKPRTKSRPFPWHCFKCRKDEVWPATISYSLKVRHDDERHEIEIPDLRIPKCSACGELNFTNSVDEQINRAVRSQLHLLQPDQIRAGRELLGLSEKELGKQLIVSEETVAGWEDDRLIQSRAEDNLMRVWFGIPAAGKTSARSTASMNWQQVSPLNLAELRLRLQYETPNEPFGHSEVIRELIGLGNAAGSLIALVAQLYRDDKLKNVPVSMLVELYIQSHDQDLLAALRDKRAFQYLNAFEKCSLFEAGVVEFEAELVQCLWQCWETACAPERVQIVRSFGRAGGQQALDVLEVIKFKLAERVNEHRARSAAPLEEDISPAEVVRRIKRGADEEFVEAVRMAIKEMTQRAVAKS